MKDTMTTVGVRLKPVLLKRLDEETEKRGVTRSECLRQITEESLNDEKVTLLLEEVRELRQLQAATQDGPSSGTQVPCAAGFAT